MAAKLTFEAKMQGMDQVLDMLKQAETRMNDFGRTGAYSLEGVDRRFKELTMSLETITKSQKGLGGLMSSFDEMGRKANDFMGKSYKGILDGMKHEVKGMQAEIDATIGKIKDTERQLENLSTKRAHMGEDEYQKQTGSLNTEKNKMMGEYVAKQYQMNEMAAQVRMATPVPGLSQGANLLGLGQLGTIGGLMQWGPGALSAGFRAPLALSQMQEAYGGAGVRQEYTKEMDGYLATRRLRLSAAQEAQQGQVTVSMLKSLGLGEENTIPGTAAYQNKEAGQYRAQQKETQGLAGVGTGIGVGIGTMVMAGMMGGATAGAALMNPWTLAAGAVAGAGYGAYRYYQAGSQEKSREEIHAENIGQFRSRDKEAYGILLDKVGELLMLEGRNLELNQRMWGMSTQHAASAAAHAAGVSPERDMITQQIMANQGLNPLSMSGINTWTNNNYRLGFSQQAQIAMTRSVALGNGNLLGAQTGAGSAAMRAGLGGAENIGQRSSMNDFGASIAATRGGSAADLGNVLAPVSGAIGANQPGMNRTEATAIGMEATQAGNNLFGGGQSSGFDMILEGKLRQLGVENIVMIKAFQKMGVQNPNTQQVIANYINNKRGTKLTAKDVAKAISGAGGQFQELNDFVLGKQNVTDMKAAGGGDLTTRFQLGNKAGDDTAMAEGQRGATLGESLSAQASNNEVAGQPAASRQNMSDIQAAGEAQKATAAEGSMDDLLAKTGQTVTDAMVKAINGGFSEAAKAVREVGAKLSTEAAAKVSHPATPYNGTKQKMSRGQQG